MNTFIQVLEGLTEVLTVLQCSLRAPTLTPKYIPRGISFLTASRFTHRFGPTYAPVCELVYAFGLTDRSQPIRSSASSADPADVELVSQHSPSSSTRGSSGSSGSRLRFLLASRLARAPRPVRLRALRPFRSACLLMRPLSALLLLRC